MIIIAKNLNWMGSQTILHNFLNSQLLKMVLINMVLNRKDGNRLKTFYLQLYGIRHMIKDPSDSERGNPLSPHNRIAHTTAFVTPVVEYWLEREIAQWVHPMKDRSNDLSHHERTLLPRSYISLLLPVKSRQL